MKSILFLFCWCGLGLLLAVADEAQPDQDLTELRVQLEKLEPALQKAYGRVQNAPAVQEAAIAAVSAWQKYEQSVLSHPKMKAHKARLDEVRATLIKKLEEEGLDALERADQERTAMEAARQAMFEAAEEIEELKRLKKGAAMVRRVYEQIRDEELSQLSPEDKALIERRKALEKALSDQEAASGR